MFAVSEMSQSKTLVFRINDHGQGPELLHQVFLERGWLAFDEDKQDEKDWNIWWRSSRFRNCDYENLLPWQRLNHFPKSAGITRKDCLVRNMKRMKGVHGAGIYNFSPVAFNLPNDYTRFVNEFSRLKQQHESETFLWICKPADLSRGRGIFIFKELSELQYDCNAVLQRYISNPLLIGGYKCDLRIYAAVPSFHPLTVYVFQEGIVRFSTEKFDLNAVKNVFAHLTNTSINIHSPGYSADKDIVGQGCKWTLTQLRYYFHQNNIGDQIIWQKIMHIIIMTLLIQAPQVPKVHNCFEVYGFDILVDENLKPWLLEVNFSPALSSDCQADVMVKKPLLHDLMDMMNFKESDAVREYKSTRPLLRSQRSQIGTRGDRFCSNFGGRSSSLQSVALLNGGMDSFSMVQQPSIIHEGNVSYLSQEMETNCKNDKTLGFGLPLHHPSDDEKRPSSGSSGHFSAKSCDLNEQTKGNVGGLISLPQASVETNFERTMTMSSVHHHERIPKKNSANSDSAISSQSGSSRGSRLISASDDAPLTSQNRQRTTFNYHDNLFERYAHSKENHSFQIRSLFPEKIKQPFNNGSIPRRLSAVSDNANQSYGNGNVFDRRLYTNQNGLPRAGKSRLGTFHARSEIDLDKKQSQFLVSNSSVHQKSGSMILPGNRPGPLLSARKNSISSQTSQKSKTLLSPVNMKSKIQGPPKKIGDLFLVFPFNEATWKTANGTLDAHLVIRELQKNLKATMKEFSSNKKVPGHLPLGTPAENEERLWAPLRPPPRDS